MSAFRIALMSLFIASAALSSGCAVESEGDETSDDIRSQDSLDKPTDTRVTLEPGLWHDNKLVPGEGWHLYHFKGKQDGFMAFEMKAPPNHPNLWSYIRVVDKTNQKEIWAGVGNKRTNHCEIIVPVENAHEYDVIITSQENSLLAAGQRQQTNGPYTVAVSPVAVTFP
jgi:hypothetical protein